MDFYESFKDQLNYVDNLPKNIKKSILAYTQPYGIYLNINKLLRQGKNMETKEQQIVLNDIEFAFKNVPKTTKELKIWRGIKPPKYEFKTEEMVSLISGSRDRKIAENFALRFMACCLVEITIPVGSSILPIENVSMSKTEQEILLNRNGKYFQTGFVEYKEGVHDDYTTYYITHIPEGSVLKN
jgi:hypothetical protein